MLTRRMGGGGPLAVVPIVVNGGTSGTATFTMPFQSASYKVVAVFCNALLGAAVITFPIPFLNAPDKSGGAVGIAGATSTTACTLTGATTTGWVFFTGF